MKLKLDFPNFFWWFWVVSLAFIIAAVAGWAPGYWIVMAISALQVLIFLFMERSLLAFPVQVRIVYLALALTGLWAAGRFYVYLLLLLGTFMVVFFGRCSISLLLKPMPWNRERTARIY